MAQNLLRSGHIPQPDNPGEKATNPERYLDLQKPYGTICGVQLAPRRFEQNGRFFDARGRVIDPVWEATQRRQAEINRIFETL